MPHMCLRGGSVFEGFMCFWNSELCVYAGSTVFVGGYPWQIDGCISDLYTSGGSRVYLLFAPSRLESASTDNDALC